MNMISVAEAQATILDYCFTLKPITLSLAEAAGHVLAKDVFAKTDIPAYPQSSMDGYALKHKDKNFPLDIVGEMAAGTATPLTIGDGQSARIFTGAPLPEGADTVVMQEKVRTASGKLLVEDQQLIAGSNVRNRGAEVIAGALAVEQGSVLTPAAIGFLAGIGFTEVSVYPMPSVSIIITGSELQSPGKPLGFGQVYEANSYSLTAALRIAGIKHITVYHAEDDLTVLKDELNKALTASDVVLLTGGVSVGDYDFVLEAANLCDVKMVFHKVKQKPGKPLFFGVKGNQLVFGLPGNPSSVLSCYYHYVLQAIDRIANRPASLKAFKAILQTGYDKNPGLTHFLKANVENGVVIPSGAQESFRLSSFAQANCMVRLEETRAGYAAGETVEIYMLPD